MADASSTTPMCAILSVQSEVAYGHVGNSAGRLPLQRLGFEVWSVNTVQLGHHPGYGAFRGHMVEPERFAAILNAVLEQAPIEHCLGVLVGYLGDALLADPIRDALDRLRARCSKLVVLLDPVIGDDGSGVFVRPPVPEAIRNKLLPRADIVTPNRFELAFLTGRAIENVDQAILAAEALLERGPKLVLATGLPSSDRNDRLVMLAAAAGERWIIETPRLGRHFNGTGDTLSALFLGHYLSAPDLRSAFERAASAIYSLVEITEQRGEEELAIVAAQEAFNGADARFSAMAV